MKNLRRSRGRGFVQRIRALLIANHVRVLRIHAGGEFGSVRYAKKWLTIIRRTPRVRFFTYTRSWRIPAIREVLDEMAAEPNLQLWYSADRDTGVPASVPDRVRIAWLMTTREDHPPRPVDLIFRVHSLRRQAQAAIEGSPICPAEDGVPRERPMTCDQCRTCWHAPVARTETLTRVPLTMVP